MNGLNNERPFASYRVGARDRFRQGGSMRNRFRLILALALPLSFVSAIALADGLKNLQVLPKTTSKDEIKQIMKSQAKALGVECDFCHDVPDMASDKNPKKLTARQMIKMTAEINQRWL